MKLFNKALKIMPLFLMSGLITGVCVNAHVNNKEVIKASAIENQPRTIKVYGDYDRFGSTSGQHKDGNSEDRGWGDNAIEMNYHENGVESYYDAYLKLKVGDKLKLVVENRTAEEQKIWIGYIDYLGNVFGTDSDNNLIAKLDGKYYLKYGANGLNDTQKEKGWRSPTGKVLLDDKNVFFKYDETSIQNDTGVPGIECYRADGKKYTAWMEHKTYEKIGDWYKQDFSTPLAMGYTKLLFTDKPGQPAQTNELDLGFMNYMHPGQDVYVNIHNTTLVDNRITVDFDVNQQRANEEIHLTNSTSRVWLDKGESFKQNEVFTGLHIWGNNKVVEFFPTSHLDISHDGYRNVCYFDIPNEYFGDGYLMMIKGYHVYSGYYSHGSTNWGTKDINTNKMMFVKPVKEGQNTKNVLSIENALNVNDKMDPENLKFVLESYYTCDPSTLNGYGDFKSFNESWLGYNAQTKKYDLLYGGELTGSINDYLTKEDYATGNNKTNNITIKQKIDMMETMYENLTSVNNVLHFEDNTIMIIVVLSSMAIALIAGFSFIYARKKRATK